jgi:hypothetical protein
MSHINIVYKEPVETPVSYYEITTNNRDKSTVQIFPKGTHISIVDTEDDSTVNLSIDQLENVMMVLSKLKSFYR